jgi:hypothetical protein
MPTILKYLEQHGAAPVARTPDGFPIRDQRVPLLKRHELDDIELSADAQVRQFETDKPEHLQQYQEILDRIANGLFYRLNERDRDLEMPLPPPRIGWVILVRYAEVKGDVPRKFYQPGV